MNKIDKEWKDLKNNMDTGNTTEELDNLKDVSKHGGKRDGAGRPAGSENRATKEDKVVREEFRQRVLKSMSKLIDAQMNLAQGTQMLFRIDKETDAKGNERNSKPELVTDQTEIEEYLAGETSDNDSYYFITTERPDNRALDSLIDRVFGKAINNVDITSGGEKLPTPLLYELYDNHSNTEDSETKQED